MAHTLYLGTRTYSSWSLRLGMLVDVFNLPLDIVWEDLSDGPAKGMRSAYPITRTVPTMVTEGGAVVGESLAVAEELASLYPDAGLWPSDPTRRAVARFVTAEMHGGFAALRTACPMNLRLRYLEFDVPEAAAKDVARIEELWTYARGFASDGPWLLGDYSIADAFYAPVAARIVGYGIEVGPEAKAYVNAHLAHGPYQAWREKGLAEDPEFPRYTMDLPATNWPDQLD